MISLTFCPQRSPGNRNTIDFIKPALTLYNNHFPVHIYFPVFCFFRSLYICRTSTAHFSLLLRYALFHSFLSDVQFITGWSKIINKPVSEKDVASVPEYQAVTPERDSKVCFHCSLRFPRST